MVIKSGKTRVAAAKVSYSAVRVRNYSVFDLCIGAQKMDFSLVCFLRCWYWCCCRGLKYLEEECAKSSEPLNADLGSVIICSEQI